MPGPGPGARGRLWIELTVVSATGQAQREQLAAGSALAPGSSAQSASVSRSALLAQLGTHNIAPKRDMPRYAQAMPAVAGAMPSLDVQARSGQQSHRYRMDRAYVNIELDGNHQQERPLRRRERQQGAVSAPARAVGMQQPPQSDHQDESAHGARTMQAPARSVQTRFADDDAGMLEGDTLVHDVPQYQQPQPQSQYGKAGPVQQPGSRFDADMMSVMHKMNGILLDSLHRNLDAYGSGRDASIEAIVNTVEAGFKEAEIADLSLVKRWGSPFLQSEGCLCSSKADRGIALQVSHPEREHVRDCRFAGRACGRRDG